MAIHLLIDPINRKFHAKMYHIFVKDILKKNHFYQKQNLLALKLIWKLLWIDISTFQVSWLLIIFAQNVFYIFVARLLHGISTAGIFSLSQLYFVEISNDKYK